MYFHVQIVTYLKSLAACINHTMLYKIYFTNPHTVTPSIDRTLHQFLTITDLDLITEFDFLPNCAKFP